MPSGDENGVGIERPRSMTGVCGHTRSVRGYSPITAQSRPIMMKKPVNRAISPSAP
jgi:hypothetical protein